MSALTERITDPYRDTTTRLLVLAEERCEKITGRMVVNVPVTDIRCD